MTILKDYEFKESFIIANHDNEFDLSRFEVGVIHQYQLSKSDKDQMGLKFTNEEQELLILDISRANQMQEIVNDTYALDIEVEGMMYHYLVYSKDQRIRSFTREYD